MVGVRARVLSFTSGSLVTPQMIERPAPAFQVDALCPYLRSLLVTEVRRSGQRLRKPQGSGFVGTRSKVAREPVRVLALLPRELPENPRSPLSSSDRFACQRGSSGCAVPLSFGVWGERSAYSG